MAETAHAFLALSAQRNLVRQVFPCPAEEVREKLLAKAVAAGRLSLVDERLCIAWQSSDA